MQTRLLTLRNLSNLLLRSVCFDKFGHQALLDACARLCAGLRAAPDGRLPIGIKASPEEIGAALDGLSKSQFRAGASALYKAGTICKPKDDCLELEAEPIWPELPEVRDPAMVSAQATAGSAVEDRLLLQASHNEVFVEVGGPSRGPIARPPHGHCAAAARPPRGYQMRGCQTRTIGTSDTHSAVASRVAFAGPSLLNVRARHDAAL